MAVWFLPFLVFSTVFERLNLYLPSLGFSLKISLLVLPLAAFFLVLKRRLSFNPTFIFPFLVFLILTEVLSVLASFDPAQSLQVVAFHILMFGLFYLIVWSTKGFGDLTRLVWAWGAGAATVSVLGIWQFFRYAWGQDPTLFFENWFPAKTLPVDTFLQSFYGILSWGTRWKFGLTDHFLRPPTTFIDVSTGASFVGIFLILGLSWFLSFKKSDLRRVLTGALMVPSAIYFLMAVSRSAALGLVSGLALFAYLSLKDRFNRLFLKVVLVASMAGVVGLGITFTAASRERLGSVLTRLTYAQDAWQMFLHDPLTGVGVGNFEPYCINIINPASSTCYPHSIFVSWLGEVGVLGLAANLSIIAALAFFVWKELNKVKYASATYFRLAGLLSAFAALIFANIFHAHYGLDFTWVLIGLLVSGYYLSKAKIGKEMEKLDVLGVAVNNVAMEEAVGAVKGFFKGGRKAYVVTPNPEFIMLSRQDGEFRKILNGADLAIPDGSGLVWASRIWGTPLKGRVTGTDLFEELCAEAARRGGRVAFLEGPEGLRSGARAAQVLKQRYPKLNVATFIISHKDDGKAISEIKKAGKGRSFDLLFLGYGEGKQERWIKRNLDKVPVKVALGTGGAFDFVAGAQVRAPYFLRKLGLEWLYRLIRQPRHRIKRQLALIPFIYLTFKESFKR